MNWSPKKMQQLQQNGKIRGFQISRGKNFSAGTAPVNKTSKALEWLSWNLQYWANENLLTMETEYRFCQDRGWRFDFAFASIKVAVEYEGGIFLQKSGHNTPKHYTKDSDKYNRATVLGWRVIRVTAMNYTTALKQLNELITDK